MTLWRRWLRFNGVGALGIGVQIAVIAALASLWDLDYRAATFAGVTAAIVHNFVWHRLWTWADRRDRGTRAFARFAAANGLMSLGGNMMVTTGLVGGAHMAVVPANLGAIAICGLINFWLGDRVVFAGPRRPSATPLEPAGRFEGRPCLLKLPRAMRRLAAITPSDTRASPSAATGSVRRSPRRRHS